MPILKDHFTYMLLLLWHLSLMTGSSHGPKIYLRGAILHTPIYGGFGHRPLLSEELVLVGALWTYFAILVLIWENHSLLAFIWHFCKFEWSCTIHTVWNSILSQNTYLQTCHLCTSSKSQITLRMFFKTKLGGARRYYRSREAVLPLPRYYRSCTERYYRSLGKLWG